jgi:hypothetical protein
MSSVAVFLLVNEILTVEQRDSSLKLEKQISISKRGSRFMFG